MRSWKGAEGGHYLEFNRERAKSCSEDRMRQAGSKLAAQKYLWKRIEVLSVVDETKYKGRALSS